MMRETALFKKTLIIIALTLVFFVNPAISLAATLSVSPTTGSFAPGCAFSVDIKLDTQGVKTDGVDAILFYDSSKLTAKQIRNGTLYSDYPQSIIDPANNKIIISGSASAASPYQGTGTLASVDFVVANEVAAGITKLSFDFDPSDKTKTTDSNVAERNNITDVLSGVTDASFTLGPTGGCAGGTIKPGGSTSSGSAVPKGGVNNNFPDGSLNPGGKHPGSAETTMILAIGGGILTILGLIGLALL